MRSNRSIRHRGAKKKKEPMEVDITSLLDVLVILLVFLLKSYNSSGVVLTVPEGITLPDSGSQTPSREAILVQVSPTTIWVDNKVIIDTAKGDKAQFDQGGRRLIALFNELVQKKKTIDETSARAKNAKPFTGLVNLMVDKTIKYDYLKKLLYTCAEAGYQKYNFIVQGENS